LLILHNKTIRYTTKKQDAITIKISKPGIPVNLNIEVIIKKIIIRITVLTNSFILYILYILINNKTFHYY